MYYFFFFFQAEDGIRDYKVTGVQTCALPICLAGARDRAARRRSGASAVPVEPRCRADPLCRLEPRRVPARRLLKDGHGHAPSWRAQTFSTQPVPSSVSTSTHEPRQAMSRFTAIPSGRKPTRRPPLSLRNPESAATVAASRAGACLSSFAAISALTPAAGTHPVALTTRLRG